MTTLAPTLAAISAGAVFMGANTYIGNAPNLMVKAIAEDRGVKMPSFFGLHGVVGCHPDPAVHHHDFHLVPLKTTPMSKPKILIARAIFPEVIAKLAQHFEVTSNQADELWTPAQLIDKLQGQTGRLHHRRRAH